MKYKISFYEDKNGKSETWDFIDSLRVKAQKSKDARIQYKQIIFYIELLKQHGTNLPNTYTKHIDEDIGELRPGNNRIFYFYFKDNTIVLLNHFRKKTQTTPRKDIEKAKQLKKDLLEREK